MWIKAIIILTLIAIIISLGSGIVFLVKDNGRSTRTVKALTIRIGLSLLLFFALLIGFATGVISPHPL